MYNYADDNTLSHKDEDSDEFVNSIEREVKDICL